MMEQKTIKAFWRRRTLWEGWIENMLLSLPERFRGQIQEIGLRAGRPITLSCGREIWFPDGHGQAVRRPQQGVPVVTAQELAAVLHRLCGYSVYSFQEELREGYLTLRGGHRVGVAGTAVMQQGRISAVKEVSSLNIRLAREKKGCADELLRRLGPELSGGLLLAGPPAAGKTTLLRQLKSALAPHGKRTGEILFDGTLIGNVGLREQSARIGYVMQDPDNQIVTDKVWHELAFGLESLGVDQKTIRLRVAEMASYFGIQGWFHKKVTELSGGQKQLLNLASIMAMQPDVLILDEPTSQLDPIAASDFLNTVRKINRELRTTVLITEHRLEDIFHASDRVVIMEDGKVLTADDPDGRVGGHF